MDLEENFILEEEKPIDKEACINSFSKCFELSKDENGNDIRIVYMDKFNRPVPKEQSVHRVIELIKKREIS